MASVSSRGVSCHAESANGHLSSAQLPRNRTLERAPDGTLSAKQQPCARALPIPLHNGQALGIGAIDRIDPTRTHFAQLGTS